jgi:hypothetical protein
MAYLMSDVATGGQAALQLQQQMAAAPNVQQVEANKMQEQQLILQQNEAKLQQEAATLQKTKLANLVAETGIKGDEESKQKLQALYKTPEFQTALNDNDYGNLIRLTGGAMMSSGKVEEGAKILVQASSFDAKKIADKQKMMDQNAQEIGNAYGVLSAIDSKNPQKIEEAFTNLPKESKDALISQVGESNWKRFTPQEKLEATKNLMLNAKGQLATQLKLADIERQILINESKERVANENNKTRIATKELGDSGIKQDREKRLAWEETTRAITSIEKSGSKTLERLNEAVDAADAAVIKAKPGSLASFFGATGDFDTANQLLTKAKETRDDFQRKQIKKQLDIAVSAPDFSSKVVVVRELQTQLAALGGAELPPPTKVGEAKAVSGSPLPAGLPTGINAPQAVKDKVMTAPGAPQAAAKAAAVPSNKEIGSKETPISMPKSKEELKKDKYYNTPRGVAKWDGSKFTTE